MQAYNRAGNLKRITTHPNRQRRRDAAKKLVKRSKDAQRAWLDQQGYTATRERVKLS